MRIIFPIILFCILSGCTSTPSAVVKKENCWSYLGNANKYRESKQYTDTFNEIEKHRLCKKDLFGMPYYYHKGWTYYELGDHPKAIESFSEGLLYQSNYLFAYWRRGLAYESMGNMKEANLDYQKAYEVGVTELGNEFFELMEEHPLIREKLIQNQDD